MRSDVQGIFSVADWQSRNNKQVQVIRPQQITCWTKKSEQEGGEFVYGSTEGLGVYQQPPLPADLNEGYPEAFVQKDEKKQSPVENIIQAVLQTHHRPQALGASHQGTKASDDGPPPPQLKGVQVFTYRNNLNKIFGTSFSIKDEWVVDGCMCRGTLFLDIVKTGEPSFPNRDIMTYWGYKFESLCTQHTLSSEQDAPRVVDSTSEYCSVVQTHIDGLCLVVASEIDLVEPQGATGAQRGGGRDLPRLSSYLELKTLKDPQGPGPMRTLVNFKWPKWWLQCFLAGVETLVLGSRDDQGQLLQIERMRVQTIPGEARRRGARWDAWRALQLGSEILHWMIAQGQGRPGVHLRFSYTAGQGGGPGVVRCQVVEEGSLPGRLHQVLDG